MRHSGSLFLGVVMGTVVFQNCSGNGKFASVQPTAQADRAIASVAAVVSVKKAANPQVVIFNRCYASLTGSAALASDPLFQQVAQGAISPIAACGQILNNVNLGTDGRPGSDPVALAVLRTVNTMHQSFFARRTFGQGIPTSDAWQRSFEIFDPEEPALHLTRSLLSVPLVPVSAVLTNPNSVSAIRPTVATDAFPYLAADPATVDLSQQVPISVIPTGPLMGVASSTTPAMIAGRMSYKQLGTAQFFTDPELQAPIDLRRSQGGGLIGSSSYLLMNFGRAMLQPSDGGLLVGRRWSEAVFGDLLCRELPALRPDDVVSQVQPQSNLPFRKQTSCMSCHTSIDGLAGATRNLLYGATPFIGLGNATAYMDSFAPTIAASQAVSSIDGDPTWFRQAPSGVLKYRDYNGDLVTHNVSSLQNVGETLAATNDFYVCMAKKYYTHFTGQAVILSDPGAFAAPVLTPAQQLQRHTVINLGLQLRADQNLRNLILRIFATDAFQANAIGGGIMTVSRRQLLNFMGLSVAGGFARDPLSSLFDAVTQNVINRAVAAEAGVAQAPRNYIFFGMPGGPTRWGFDQILKVGSDAPFSECASLKNAFEQDANGTITGYSYKTFAVNHSGQNLQMPILWNAQIPTVGGTTHMLNLLDHMMVMRGINLGIDGHVSNYVRQLWPNSAGPSLNGLVADQSARPFPAVSYHGSTSNYNSATGASQVSIPDSANPLGDAFALFKLNSGTYRDTAAVKSAVDQSLSLLQYYALSNQPGAATLYRSRRDAEQLLRQGFDGLADQYNALVQKYSALITASLGMVTSGVVSQAHLPLLRNPAEKTRLGDGTFVTAANLGQLLPGDALPHMAASMAVTEYLIVNNLTSSVQTTLDPVRLAAQSGAGGVQYAAGARLDTFHDQHFMTPAMTILLTTSLFHAFSACLYELIGTLSANKTAEGKNLFEETVIHLAAEFSRSPDSAGMSTDHGVAGSTVSAWSGALTRSGVVGNLLKNSTDPTHAGTWMGAPMQSLSNLPIQIGNVASTMAQLLRVETPTPNNISLLEEAAGDSFTPISEAKNVAN